ncbi:MAG: hypothetical protein IJW48_00020 [Clostridia bacterium]|nr:hypothetical protein [Clostridia bacterium]
MKKIRIIFTFIYVCLCLICLSSCWGSKYEFMHTREEIVSVEIVEADYDYTNSTPSQDTLLVIDDYNSFLDKLESLNYDWRVIGGPVGIDSKCVAIKILYQNGDYEVFNYAGRAEYEYGVGYDAYCDWGSFPKKEFYALLEEYIGYDATPR